MIIPDLNLANHFLIAMPSLVDPVLGGAVVYICEHNADGALGLIINRPTDMTFETLLERINLKLEHLKLEHLNLEIMTSIPDIPQKIVMFGGPVQSERGFVLHGPYTSYSSTLKITDDVALTTSKDVLEAVAAGCGPNQFLVALGCSGWGTGQLEDEIGKNCWLTVAADPKIIFSLPVEERFDEAIKLLGIEPFTLSSDLGHA